MDKKVLLESLKGTGYQKIVESYLDGAEREKSSPLEEGIGTVAIGVVAGLLGLKAFSLILKKASKFLLGKAIKPKLQRLRECQARLIELMQKYPETAKKIRSGLHDRLFRDRSKNSLTLYVPLGGLKRDLEGWSEEDREEFMKNYDEICNIQDNILKGIDPNFLDKIDPDSIDTNRAVEKFMSR